MTEAELQLVNLLIDKTHARAVRWYADDDWYVAEIGDTKARIRREQAFRYQERINNYFLGLTDGHGLLFTAHSDVSVESVNDDRLEALFNAAEVVAAGTQERIAETIETLKSL